MICHQLLTIGKLQLDMEQSFKIKENNKPN